MPRIPISENIDYSHISHFLFYLFLGFYYPNKYYIALILSILWEIFESIIVYNDILYYLTKKYWVVPEKYWNENMFNKILDIILNLFGYYLGTMIKLNIKNRK